MGHPEATDRTARPPLEVRRPLRAGLALAAVVALTGCSSSTDSAAPPRTDRSAASGAATSSAAPHGTATASGTSRPPPRPTSAEPSGPPAATASSVGVSMLPPVAAGSDADFGDGLVAVVTGTDAVQLGASGPGEVAGPGVAVHLTLRNGTRSPVDLSGVTVNATYGEGTPASASDAAPSARPSGTLAPGASAKGTWAFSMPARDQSSLQVQVGSVSSPNVVVVRAQG